MRLTVNMSGNVSSILSLNSVDCRKTSDNKVLCELFNKIKSERNNFNKHRQLFEVINECLKDNNNLSVVLKNKIKNILHFNNVTPCLKLKTKTSDQNLLGLNDGHMELTLEEGQMLNEAIRVKLKTRKVALGSLLEENHEQNALGKILHDTKKKLNQVQEEYVDKLQSYHSCLENFVKLRLESVKDFTDSKIDENKLKGKMLRLRSEITTMRTNVGIYEELPISNKAYQTVTKDILEEQKECQIEIDQLIQLKEKYQQVSCKQYDQILQSYRQFKNSIDKKKQFLQQIKKM